MNTNNDQNMDIGIHGHHGCTSNGLVSSSSALNVFSRPFREVSKGKHREVLQKHSASTNLSTRKSDRGQGVQMLLLDGGDQDNSSLALHQDHDHHAIEETASSSKNHGDSDRYSHKDPASPTPPQPPRVVLSSQSSSTSLGHQRPGGLVAPLPPDFSPQPWSVIIGRDRIALEAIGNKRLQVLIGCYIKSYAKSYNCKYEKSRIITEIESTIRSACGGRGSQGAFIKYKDGVWWEADPVLIREKIGRQLRESLHTKYTSSSRRKRARLRLDNKLTDNKVHRLTCPLRPNLNHK